MDDVLRIATTGSVDDGKSTLIGRLLYDTASVPADKLDDLVRASKRRGSEGPDYSLLTDGLLAEREQGITIDVAHVFFRTPTRKFIIADAPGHEQYTRNMATGASNSTVALVLVDAQNGSLLQTYRHFFIAHTFRLATIIVCVNKMDAVGYREEKFCAAVNQLAAFATRLGFPLHRLFFVPVSAKFGDTVISRSANMPWYRGKSLLELLETVETSVDAETLPLRFRVQMVIRPKSPEYADYRGYAGKIVSGSLRVGDRIMVLPSRRPSQVAAIDIFGRTVERAGAGTMPTIRLSDDIDVGRGDTIVHEDHLPTSGRTFPARVFWLHEQPTQIRKRYLVQHGTRRIVGHISSVQRVIHPESLESIEAKDTLALNDIGDITITCSSELHIDPYGSNKGNGAFILIDESTNETVAVGVFS